MSDQSERMLRAAMKDQYRTLQAEINSLRAENAALQADLATTQEAFEKRGELWAKDRADLDALREALEWARFRILAASSVESMKDVTLMAGLARITAALERHP